MKKASIAIALVLVFGLFVTASSLSRTAVAQNLTSNATTSTNATTAGNATTSTNATTAEGSTFTATGSIATFLDTTGVAATTSSSANTGATTNAATTGNTSASGNTTSGNTTSGGNTTTMGQTIVGGPYSSTAGNATNMTSSSNATSAGSPSTGNATMATQAASKLYILSGDWNLNVQNGQVMNFMSNFTMVHPDGTGRHTHGVTNFKLDSGSTITLNPNGTTFIPGTADISANGQSKWTGVPTLILIDHNNAFSISFASQATDSHFGVGQPIFGVVKSLKDQNGNEMIHGAATAGGTSTTGNATAGAGGFLGNVTQGLSKLFGGNSTK
jgi:hypothetical protein